MKTIRVSEEVWDEIARRGKFGETEEDVLRRVFDLKAIEDLEKGGGMTETTRVKPKRRTYATIPMSARIERSQFIVDFTGGERKEWNLPDKTDKTGIRRVRDEAVRFALDQGASDPGQKNAVMKALTNAGYFLTR